MHLNFHEFVSSTCRVLLIKRLDLFDITDPSVF